MSKFRSILQVISLVLIVCLMLNLRGAQAAGSPGSAFTYQGQLRDGSGNPVTNTCDFQFGLYAAASGGSPVTGTTLQTIPGVVVTNGYFTVSLDFGASAFDGNARWLEISVSCPSGGSYVTLSPRQALTAAPYAIYAVNADLLDGQHASAFQQHSQNVRVVAKSGGDYTTITAALNSITDAAAANPYLIYVAPGVYTEQVTMKPYVDIEGAGELATKITYTGTNAFFTATVLGADNTELRFLTVENIGGNSIATAISDPCGITQRLTHITAIASEGSSQTTGVEVTCGDPSILTNVNATASGGTGVKYGLRIVGKATLTDVSGTALGGTGNNFGVWIGSYAPTLMNVTATASDGTTNYAVYNTNSSSPTLMNVIANASGGTYAYGVYNLSSSSTMRGVAATASGGSYRNFGVYNNSSSPTMTNVTASASGGTDNYGVYNEASAAPTMTNVTVTASGGTNTYGVYNTASSPVMTNVKVSASGATWNRGVANYSSSLTMTELTATVSGGNDSYGVWNDSSSVVIQNSVINASTGAYSNDGIHNTASSGAYTVTIDASQITGFNSTIYSDSGYYTIMIGASELIGGGAQGPGIYKCVASYNGSYTALGITCH